MTPICYVFPPTGGCIVDDEGPLLCHNHEQSLNMSAASVASSDNVQLRGSNETICWSSLPGEAALAGDLITLLKFNAALKAQPLENHQPA